MKRTLLLLPLVFIALAFLAYRHFDTQRDDRLHQELDGYALAHELKPLRPGAANQLRLWFLEPLEGGVGAAVFTDSGALHCKGTSAYDSSDASLKMKSSGCQRSRIALSATELASTLRSLRALEDRRTSCDEVMDGWRVTVDGVVDGERFAFESWNPDGCDQTASKTLSAILAGIEKRKRS